MRIFSILTIAAAAAALYYFYSRRTLEQPEYDDGKPVGDDTLTERVRKRLAMGLQGREVDARVSHGVVMLRGTVSRQDRDDALSIVLAVPGVSRVANYLELSDPLAERDLGYAT